MFNNQPNTHDVICSHLYQNGYLKGLYADMIIRMQFQNQSKQPVQSSIDGIMFKLHRIIAVRSPLLQKLLADQEQGEFQQVTLSLVTSDPQITPRGLAIAFGHLYASYSQLLLSDENPDDRETRPDLLCSVLASANLLQLGDLAALATEYIKQNVNRMTIVTYCLAIQGTTYQSSQDLKDFLFTYLCRGIVHEIIEEFGLLWGNPEGKASQALVKIFGQLPFEWIKSVIESQYFEVPTDMERFSFAKLVIDYRTREGTAVGEENVLLSFGGKKHGVTLVRKTKPFVIGDRNERRVWKTGQV